MESVLLMGFGIRWRWRLLVVYGEIIQLLVLIVQIPVVVVIVTIIVIVFIDVVIRGIVNVVAHVWLGHPGDVVVEVDEQACDDGAREAGYPHVERAVEVDEIIRYLLVEQEIRVVQVCCEDVEGNKMFQS